MASTPPPAAEKLAPYRRKRNFSRTSEPEGEAKNTEPEGEVNGTEPEGEAKNTEPAAPASRRFVVQRHRARRLHYDVRFEIGGVLVSWAVPKGPTLDPAARHAAFHVEDHPIEYIDFEGVIPAGEYGGGDVIVWDAGIWQPREAGEPPDPAAALDAGELHVDLF